MEVEITIGKVSAVFAALMIVGMLASPVLAFGPGQSASVGNNKNLKILEEEDLVINYRGNAAGFNSWAEGETERDWMQFQFRDTRSAKGVMNNALVCHLQDVNPKFLMVDNENQWIYLSGDAPGQPNRTPSGRGTLYLYMAAVFGPTDAGIMAAEYPNGAFYKYNIVK